MLFRSTYIISAQKGCGGLFPLPNPTFQYTDPVTGSVTLVTVAKGTSVTINSLGAPTFVSGCTRYNIVSSNKTNVDAFPANLDGFNNTESPYRQVFNSPETSFGQPTLGNVLKLESILFGAGKAHFVEVQKHAMYKLLTRQAQIDALNSSKQIADLGGFSATAFFTAYQTYLQIYITGISRKNFAYSFNSIASYDYTVDVPNNQGVKQRQLDKYQYVFPGVQSVSDIHDLNNWNRESSVYVKSLTTRNGLGVSPLPYPNESPNLFVAGQSQIGRAHV